VTEQERGRDDASLTVTFADGRVARWTSADLERVAQREREPTERGDVSAWSLRDVVATLVDKDARVDVIANGAGETSTISTAAWLDVQRAPVLRANQRGLWKFDWIDATTKQPMRDGRLRNVTALRIAAVEREASLAVR
jgi:NAD(P)-dependent dehydrogenase (short-subunit alcohol dehydrogenase family)